DLLGHGVVACPNPQMALWSSHPKVYIDLSHDGQGRCPYCGTEYRLKAGETLAHGH
ncbi:MAG: zinc-finger domain-containing protein, partial [Inhella sp.]